MKRSYKLKEWIAERTPAQYPVPRYAVATRSTHFMSIGERIAWGSLLFVLILFLSCALALGVYIAVDILFS